MAAGQVGFKKDKLVRKVFVDTRINAVVNRLNKTKTEEFPDLQQQRLDYDKEVKNNKDAEKRTLAKEQQRIALERKQLAYQRDHAYDDVFTEENVRHTSNQFRGDDFEDDFM